MVASDRKSPNLVTRETFSFLCFRLHLLGHEAGGTTTDILKYLLNHLWYRLLAKNQRQQKQKDANQIWLQESRHTDRLLVHCRNIS